MESSKKHLVNTGKDIPEKIVMADLHEITEHLSDRLFNEDRMYKYVRTYAQVHGLKQTQKILPYARDLHREQYRRGRDHVPYIYHPLLVSCHALALNLDEDDLISTALLHDVCEDCHVTPEELPVNKETREAVRLLTRDFSEKGFTDAGKKEYYDRISENRIATMIKLLDRCNNVSSMTTGFSREKMLGYIRDTEKWIYPLYYRAKNFYPEHSNQIFLIKYHMSSVIETIKHLVGEELTFVKKQQENGGQSVEEVIQSFDQIVRNQMLMEQKQEDK